MTDVSAFPGGLPTDYRMHLEWVRHAAEGATIDAFDLIELLADFGHKFQLRFMVAIQVQQARQPPCRRLRHYGPLICREHRDENIFRVDLTALEPADRRIVLIHFRLL